MLVLRHPTATFCAEAADQKRLGHAETAFCLKW
jgi:hypothetical protein